MSAVTSGMRLTAMTSDRYDPERARRVSWMTDEDWYYTEWYRDQYLAEPELDEGGCGNGCCPDTGEDE